MEYICRSNGGFKITAWGDNMNKPHAFKITGYVRVTLEIVAVDSDAACDQFQAMQYADLDFHEREITDIEELGEHYAD